MAKKVKLVIGKGLQDGTASNARIILEQRYGAGSSVEACIKTHFGVDKGAIKLNADGDASATKGKDKPSKK